jgi:tetratricopeptide (TPR) repeat protein
MLRVVTTVVVCAVVTVAVAPREARADIESELVKQGIAAYNDLEYPRAIELLQKALQETLTRQEKLVTYQTLAFAHVALDKTEAAIIDFENVLRIDESFELDRTISPRVRAVFEEAKARVATGQGVDGPSTDVTRALPTLHPDVSPARPKEGQSLGVYVVYPGGVAAKLELFYRTRGQSLYSKTTAVADRAGRFAAVIPGSDVHGPALEYYAAVLDDSGSSVARAGSLGQPLAVDVTVRKKPIYAKGWFWGVIGGVAVVGAGIATAVALGTRSSVGPTTPATVTIQPQ